MYIFLVSSHLVLPCLALSLLALHCRIMYYSLILYFVQTHLVLLVVLSSPFCFFGPQEEAAEKSQKYKEGKFILERCAVTRENCGGSDRFGSDRFGSDGFGSDRFDSGRFGSDRCRSNIVGWGSENAPFADSARW